MGEDKKLMIPTRDGFGEALVELGKTEPLVRNSLIASFTNNQRSRLFFVFKVIRLSCSDEVIL